MSFGNYGNFFLKTQKSKLLWSGKFIKTCINNILNSALLLSKSPGLKHDLSHSCKVTQVIFFDIWLQFGLHFFSHQAYLTYISEM